MAMSENEKWSEDTYKLQQLVNELPRFVRVNQGIYINNDPESFSTGDIIWLEEKRTIQKVLAQEVDISDWSVDAEEILIPLRLKCAVKVLIPEKAKRTTDLVSKLADSWPRYVRVDIDFTSPCGRRFTRGSRFEIEPIQSQRGFYSKNSLVVKYDNRDILLPLNLWGLFTPLEDYNSYDLKQVVDRYSLPQYVKVLGNEIQHLITTDTDESIQNIKSCRKYSIFRLSSIESIEVIIGHIKPVSSDVIKSKSDFCQRNGIIIPLNKRPVSDIKFQIPVYSKSSDYKMIRMRNFSNCAKHGEETFDGLYIEYKKNPRVYIVPSTSEQTTSKHTEERRFNNPPVHLTTNSLLDMNIKSMPKEAQRPKCDIRPSTDPRGNEDPCKIRYINIKSMPQEAQTPICEIRPSADPDGYEVPCCFRNSTDNQSHKKSVTSDDLTLPGSENLVYDYTDMSKVDLVSDRQLMVKLVGIVSPERQTKSKELSSTDDLISFSVRKLCKELKMCGLNSLSVVCKNEHLDGKFFCTLTDRDLSRSPFNLKHLDILKIHEFIKGWRPKIK